MNLFAKAKKSAPKTTKAKTEKTRISISDETFYDKIERLETLNTEMKSAKAKADIISSEIKEIGKEEWSNLYSETRKNPGSVMLENIKNGNIAQVMFVPADRYIKINEERAEELREEYDEDIVEESTKFSFDSKMIEKYGEVLSSLIMESDEIAEADKSKIIKATTSYSVSKGTIDNLSDYNDDVMEMMEVVKPVISLKNVEVING